MFATLDYPRSLRSLNVYFHCLTYAGNLQSAYVFTMNRGTGNKIPVIENLGATENQFDCIDFSDNEVVRLDGFPPLKRLKTLLLNNNRISRISVSIGESIPNLQMLVLTGNKLSVLPDIKALRVLSKLQFLSLCDNPVSKKPGYR